MRFGKFAVACGLAAIAAESSAADLSPESSVLSPPTRFERVVIDDNFPGGYQVEVADVNGDGKPDVIGVGGGTCAWYENPSWKKRVVSTPKETPSIISSATADLDGDGKAEVAIAYDFSMNEPRRGKLLLAIQGAKPDDPWTFQPIRQINGLPSPSGGIGGGGGGFASASGGFGGPSGGAGQPAESSSDKAPSIHRLRWGIYPSIRVASGSVSYEKRRGLFVGPIFGASAKPPAFEQESARLVVFDPGADPKSGRWKSFLVGFAPVLHAIDVISLEDDGYSTVLGASNLGVTSFRMNPAIGSGELFQVQALAQGAPGDAPKKGSSEVHLGKLKDGRKFLSTVEPWHGTDVAIYTSESLKPLKFGPRTVIDTTMKEGHALWVADVDGDGDDEVFAGYRGGSGGVLMFDFNGKTWDRTVLDPAVAAQDLRGGDLDGDGKPDVVAIGGRTHNVVWYRPIREK